MKGSAAVEVLRVDDLDVQVRVSERRRGIRLTVERDSTVSVTVPPGTGQTELVKLVRSRRQWLYTKLAERESLSEGRPPRDYVSGEGFPYLGRSHRLMVVETGPTDVRLLRGRLEIRQNVLHDASTALITWYTRRGTSWLPSRLQPWAKRLDVTCSELRVRPLGYRWGSCSIHGDLNIHWATMQLPPDLIDYVLVHELAHLRVPDHSERFWRTVQRAMPDCDARRDRLRRIGPDLWLPEPKFAT
ncbi:M48 family metallopeptidase [Streptomyces sp. N2-109]|uniref:M48 family metallopeptidase n=1 Tax=Streptomyces gossypii TaxID=2883101 RepID=A0ABT2JP94_9ACTN|nr:SprT family zinc-dependent metalloprotease [Streptomyces gossypii]MCT2589702.1 M48 family metallopeptidase [Streptomyces gossypii]